MSIEVIVSSSPCLDFDSKSLAAPADAWLDDLRGAEGFRCWWVVPTSRCKREIVRRRTGRLPRLMTIEGLVEHLGASSINQRAFLGNTGRLLRISRAWMESGHKSPLTPGRVIQLDRIASEWRESGEKPQGGHAHAAFLDKFDQLLKNEKFIDRPGWIETLASEITKGDSPLPGMVARAKCVLFDGFHRFTGEEMNLIEALAKRSTVRLWLVGEGGQSFHANVQEVLDRLQIRKQLSVPRSPPPLAAVGQWLFGVPNGSVPKAPLEVIVTAKAAAEAEAVARRIKELHRSWGEGARLADVAVVVPDDSYISLLRSSLAAAQIECTPAAESFALDQSRPVRLLQAAMRLARHQWPIDALFDFLRQPLILRALKPARWLDQLQRLSPRREKPSTWDKWRQTWLKAIDRWEKSESEEKDESEEVRQKRLQAAAELRTLVDSIDDVLQPVRHLQDELQGKSFDDPKKLSVAIVRLLNEVGLHDWLSPASRPNWDLTPAREWEIDQQAFNNLKDVLAELAEAPAKGFDADLALPLALAGESFKTGASDDAGVQILLPATIRGLRFRAIFAVGLVEGLVPPTPRDDAPDEALDVIRARRRRQERHEHEYLFTQLFESASERLVLTRPQKDGDVELIASPFLRRLVERTGIEPGAPPQTLVDPALAMLHVAQLKPEQMEPLKPLIAARETWKSSRQPNDKLQILKWAMPLMAMRYPKEKSFSATALEKYAACPFQHFAVKTLGLEEFERDDSAMRNGLFVHAVLEDFFNEWKQTRTAAGWDRDAGDRLLRRLFKDRWQRDGSDLDLSLEHDFSKALTEAFINITSKFNEKGFEQVSAEWEFKDVLIEDGPNSILLYGKIDRVDRNDQESAELICDFKTGKVDHAKLANRLQSGRLLQLPLYGLARQLSTRVPVKFGAYIRLSRKVERDTTPSDTPKFVEQVGKLLESGRKSDPPPFDPEVAGKLAVALATDMRSGRISLTTFDVDDRDPACVSYCAARHACRQPKGY